MLSRWFKDLISTVNTMWWTQNPMAQWLGSLTHKFLIMANVPDIPLFPPGQTPVVTTRTEAACLRLQQQGIYSLSKDSIHWINQSSAHHLPSKFPTHYSYWDQHFYFCGFFSIIIFNVGGNIITTSPLHLRYSWLDQVFPSSANL